MIRAMREEGLIRVLKLNLLVAGFNDGGVVSDKKDALSMTCGTQTVHATGKRNEASQNC